MAHNSQRRQQARSPRPRTAWRASLPSLFLLGCIFELGDLQDLPGGIGGSGTGGVGASGVGGSSVPPGGSFNGGSAGASVSPDGCPEGQKRCNTGACLPIALETGCQSAVCQPCAKPANASVSCSADTGLCQVDGCDVGFADCNGDLNGYTGTVSGDGCEYQFGADLRSFTEVLDVPFARIDIADGGRGDWGNIPAYSLDATCDNCVDDRLPEVTAQNEAPSKRDLDGYFRVAWDGDFFYVLGEVFDDQLFADGLSLMDGRCGNNGAMCEDAFTVFIDGRNDRLTPGKNAYQNDDIRVFLGLSGAAFRPSAQEVVAQQVDLRRSLIGASCYQVEAQFDWEFIAATQNQQAVSGIFPPANGQEYGFDVSLNDWDLAISEEKPQRQSQMFWLSPGADYNRLTTGFARMKLSGAPP